MTKTTRYLLAALALYLVLLIWGTFAPSHLNWGVHALGFHSIIIRLGAAIFMIIMVIPRYQEMAMRPVEGIVKFLAKVSAPLLCVTLSVIVIAGAFLVAPSVHLLGDGAILIRSIPKSDWGEEMIVSFKNQPLLNIVYRWAMNLRSAETPVNPRDVYFTIDCIAAVIFIALLLWMVQAIQRSPLERWYLGSLLFFAAGSQFFFGYVENYVLQYVATAAYVITGWFALERRVPIVVPMLLFALLPGLNLGSLIFLPSLGFILFWQFRDRKLAAFLVLAVLGAVAIGGLVALRFDLAGFIGHFTTGNVDFLQLFRAEGGNFPYAMFSLMHLVDWLNAALLIAPLGLMVPGILIAALPAEERWKNPALLFLLITAACGILFTWTVNAALGMARDWDMLSSYFVPLIILSVYLLARSAALEPRRYLLVLFSGAMFLHSALWIGLNADGARHVARAKALNDTRLLSLATQMTYNEAMANYFFGQRDYQQAESYYEDYMKIGPSNPRIIANLSDVYRKLGDRDNYFEMLKRAVAVNSMNPGVYSNLGVEYANRGDTTSAIELNERAVNIDPGQQKAHANLGILYMSRRNFRLADQHFSTAINLGMRDPVLFRYGGDACIILGDYPRALRNYESYLELNPSDQQVRSIRDKVREAMRKASPH